uniref:Inter-alpha-trypsin inhibitor heavy chain 3 n=1 Tax=Oryzias latipes TaxID=8090 RepID=A0A3P9II17_ORYLA
MPSDLVVLTLIPAASHLAANYPNTRRRSWLDEANRTTSSAKNREEILWSSNQTSLGPWLCLEILSIKTNDWDIYSFHINSTVSNRYATTVITSRVANRMGESKEIEFHVQIPKNAFISKFIMYIDEQAYDGVVKTKEKAQQQYTQAVSRGQSAGIVSSVGRTLEEFRTSVTVAANKKVTFELTYEELIDFKVDVYMHEKAGITFVDIKGGLSVKELANAITKTQEDKQAWVHFYPTVKQQQTCDGCGEQGLNGDLIIYYDVQRENKFGDIQKGDGYFVHHFAPSRLPRILKNVVFVIDRSGSMSGTKIEQTRTALLQILSDLAEEDFFGLITFDSEIFYWKKELVPATIDNVEKAKVFARNIRDRGGRATDINAALLEGAKMLTKYPREGSASILILLTDGDPTSGVTNRETIQANVRRAIAGKFPLYCLGFGFDVSFEFLQKLSLTNNGVARRIYEDADADLQLKGFYEEVATPLLTDVTMIYEGGTNLTQTNFSQYYNGSEIVVAGQILDNEVDNFIPQVVAISVTSNHPDPIENVPDSVLERVWAYLTVKQLLEQELKSSGKRALELSLKYSFVTPLTSMVVTKPQEEDTEVLHKPQEGNPQPDHLQYGLQSEQTRIHDKGQNYHPNPPAGTLNVPSSLRSEAITWAHASRVACHGGIARTPNLLCRRFYWPPWSISSPDYPPPPRVIPSSLPVSTDSLNLCISFPCLSSPPLKLLRFWSSLSSATMGSPKILCPTEGPNSCPKFGRPSVPPWVPLSAPPQGTTLNRMDSLKEPIRSLRHPSVVWPIVAIRSWWIGRVTVQRSAPGSPAPSFWIVPSLMTSFAPTRIGVPDRLEAVVEGRGVLSW